MKITRVRAAAYQAHNLITGWQVSLGGRDLYDLVFVRVDTDQGVSGVGISSPGAVYITGDSAANHLQLINHVAANVHLAVSLRNLALPCEIGEFERMADDPCTGLEIVDGFLSPPERPGLGVEVDLNRAGLSDP